MSPELYRRARRAEAKADRADDRRRLRLDFFRAALAEGLDSVKVMHAGGASGQESVQAHARVVDDLVKSLTKLITGDTNGLAATPFVVIALGGYGRGELHPSSDIDLMVIYDAELSPYVQRVTQELLYTLWDLEVALVDVLLEHATEPGEQPAVAGQEPRRLHGRSARQVGPGDRDTVRQRTQAVADLESEVPQRVEQLLGHPLDVRGQLSVVNHHEVDVGRRMELAAAVTAQGDDDERGCRQTIGVACNELRQRLHEVVHHAGVGLHGLLAGGATGVHDLHGVEPLGEGSTEEVEPESPPVVRAVGLGLGAPGPAIQLGRHDEAERRNPRRILSNRTRTYYNAKMRRIWRAAVDRIAPYDPGRPLEALASDLGRTDLVRLSANESPLGPSPRVVEAIAREAARVHLYPDGGSTSLREALGARLGVGPPPTVVGNGAVELLALIGWAALEPGDEVIIPQPSFEPNTTVVELMGARGVPSPLAKYETDLDDMASRLTARTKAIVLCSPHNPAGTIIPPAPPTAFPRALGHDAPLILLDEAYCDFCDDPEYPDGVTLLAHYPRLILLTFSKIAGLAGLRVGYTVATAEVAERLNRVRAPYNVNRLGQVAALAALEDRAHWERTRDVVIRERGECGDLSE